MCIRRQPEGLGLPPPPSVALQSIMAITAVLIIGGIAASVIVPYVFASAKADEEYAKMTSINLNVIFISIHFFFFLK